MKTKESAVKTLTRSAVLAAMIYVVTMIHIPIGMGGYGHVGDAIIYLAVLLLPLPYAMGAAGIGAMLADLTLGYAVYMLPSLIIKMVLALTAAGLRRLSKNGLHQDILMSLSGIVTVAGYYIAEVIILITGGSGLGAAFATAAADTLPLNCLQALASAVVFVIAGGLLRSTSYFKRLSGSDDTNEHK